MKAKEISENIATRIEHGLHENDLQIASYKRVGVFFSAASTICAIIAISSKRVVPIVPLIAAAASGLCSIVAFRLARDERKKVKMDQEMLKILGTISDEKFDQLKNSLTGTERDGDVAREWAKTIARESAQVQSQLSR